MFYAIATLIDQTTWGRILDKNPAIRDLIVSRQNQQEFIHFSWLISEDLDKEKTIKLIEDVAKSTVEFDIQSGGIGIFTGTVPAITYVLARNEAVTRTHLQLWNKSAGIMGSVNIKYSPERWIPHITILHYGLEAREYCEFLEKSIESEVSFTIDVNNLAIIYKDENSAGLLYKVDLQKRAVAPIKFDVPR
jgi:2'-5' RNA ligase